MSTPQSPQPTEPAVSAHAGHDVPTSVLVSVFVALLVLTFVTVAVTWIDLGNFRIWVALGIASVKAMLVALFFMHLAYEQRFNTIVLLTTLFFVVFFIGLSTLDVFQYRKDIDSFRAAHPERAVPQIDQSLSATESTSPAD